MRTGRRITCVHANVTPAPREVVYRGAVSDLADQALTLALGDRPLDQGWAALIALFSKAAPDKAWDELGRLRLGEDVDALQVWLRELGKKERPGDDVVALWFGLFEGQDGESRETGALLYVAGADRFDPLDDDWPCDPAWFPDGRYASPAALWRVSTALARAGAKARNVADLACVACAALLVRAALPAVAAAVAPKDPRAVGVGWDDGDVLDRKSVV